MASKQNSIVAALVLDSAPFNKAIKGATKSIEQFGAKIGGIGRNISFSVGLPLLAAAKNAYEVGKAFELIQAKIQGVFGAAAPVQRLVDSAKELGETTIFTATQVGELQLELAKLGKSVDVIDQLEEPILKFAQALDQDLGESAKFIVQTLNRSAASFQDFGSDVEKASYVSDVFARATQLSALSAETLRSSLNYVGAEAAAAGVPFEKTVALLGLLANRGYEGSKAGTKLRYIFTQLAKSGKDVNSAIDNLTATSTSFAEQVELVGVRSAGAASSLNLTSDELKEFERLLRDASGTTDKFKSAIDQTTFNIEKELVSALEALQIKLFELYQGDLNEFFKELTVAIRNLKKEDVENIGAVAEGLGKLAGLGFVAAIVGPIIQLFGFLSKPLSKLGPLLGKLAKGFGRVSASVGSFTSGITGLSSLLARVLAKFVQFGRAITSFFAAWGPLGAIAALAIEGIIVGVEKLYRAWRQTRLEKEIAEQKESLDDLETSQQRYLEGLGAEEVARRLQKNFKLISDYYRGQAALADEATILEDGTVLNPLRDLAVSKKDFEEFAQVLAQIEASGQNLFGQELKAAALEFLRIKGVIDEIPNSNGGVTPPVVVFDADADRTALKALRAELDSLVGDYGRSGAVITEDELARVEEINEEIKDITERLDRIQQPDQPRAIDPNDGFFTFFASDEFNKEANDFADSLKKIQDAKKEAESDISLQKALGYEDGDEGLIDELGDRLDTLTSQYKILKEAGLDVLAEGVLNNIAGLSAYIDYLEEVAEATEKVTEAQKEQAEEIKNLAYAFGDLLGSALTAAISGTQSFGEALRNNLRNAVASAIGQLVKLVTAYVALIVVKSIAAPGSVAGAAAASAMGQNFTSFMLAGFGLGSFGTRSVGSSTLISGSNLIVATNRGITAQDRIYG